MTLRFSSGKGAVLTPCSCGFRGGIYKYDEISKLEVVKSHFFDKAGLIAELRNICDTAITAYKNSENSVSFDLTYNGKSFNINFDFWEQYMPMFRFMLAAVIYLGFAWRTYRKIPFYISGGGDDN